MQSWFNATTIAKKLSLINLLTTGIAGLLIAVVLVADSWYTQRSDLVKDTQVKASVIAQGVLPALMFADKKSADDTLATLDKDEAVLEARVFDKTHESFASHLRTTNNIASNTRALNNADGLQQVTFNLADLTVITPISSGNDQAGTLLIRVDLRGLYSRVLQFSLIIVFTVLIALILASILLSRMQRSITVPLANLSKVMTEVSEQHDYTRRAEVTSQDEIGSLAHSFNAMVTEIQRHDGMLSEELLTRKRAEVQLEKMAHFDNVTNLPNRHFFNRRASDLVQLNQGSGHRIALLFIDLDNFKYVNDTFGHHSGDLLLIGVAERLKNAVRTSDMVARFGGDEFAVLLGNPSSIEQVEKIAQKILVSLGEAFDINEYQFHIGASIGLAMLPDHSDTIEELLKQADAAMYQAKSSGKNNVQIWTPETSSVSAKHFEMESGLRKAMMNDEFIIHYQPIIDLTNEKIVGMEALLRWQHPTLGLISPAEFIPLAEETSLIIPIGEWVLRNACATAQNWQKRYGALYISVNVSAKQFQNVNLPQTIAAILRETHLPAECLELEMTESMLMDHTVATTNKLNEIAAMGVGLSLDDFGTGYSSLLYLKRFPLTKLKIDRGFITDLPDDAEDKAITQAIIALSKSLNLKVLAEGVETAEQAAFLTKNQCQFGQGYFYSKPLDAKSFTALLQSKKFDFDNDEVL
ncbi:MAG: EAL domain-containing protein [Gallionella sp.]|nr:EAL domain-containing protein [Gallionella sp.]